MGLAAVPDLAVIGEIEAVIRVDVEVEPGAEHDRVGDDWRSDDREAGAACKRSGHAGRAGESVPPADRPLRRQQHPIPDDELAVRAHPKGGERGIDRAGGAAERRWAAAFDEGVSVLPLIAKARI